MLVKRTTPSPASSSKVVSIQNYSRRLESLYARRTAVKALIASLEDYQRFRERRIEHGQSKTA
jgi:hypothetical protein